MDTLSYKTISANKATVDKKWLLINAENEILGRLAAKVALILRGKHKADFTPHVDGGDNVVIINASKIKLTGQKWSDRQHFSHSGYPGGQKIQTPEDLFKKNPSLVIEHAVRGMLPKNRLGRAIFKNMKIYNGSEHPHEAQNPELTDLNTIK